MSNRRTIAIDFDGTIMEYDGWKDGSTYGKPIKGAFDTIVRLRLRGYDVVVFSARPAQQIKEWFLLHWPFKPPYAEPPLITNQKPAAVAYIDDRAIRFHDYEQVWRDLAKYVFKK